MRLSGFHIKIFSYCKRIRIINGLARIHFSCVGNMFTCYNHGVVSVEFCRVMTVQHQH